MLLMGLLLVVFFFCWNIAVLSKPAKSCFSLHNSIFNIIINVQQNKNFYKYKWWSNRIDLSITLLLNIELLHHSNESVKAVFLWGFTQRANKTQPMRNFGQRASFVNFTFFHSRWIRENRWNWFWFCIVIATLNIINNYFDARWAQSMSKDYDQKT